MCPKPLLILGVQVMGGGRDCVFGELLTWVTLQDLSVPVVKSGWMSMAERATRPSKGSSDTKVCSSGHVVSLH